MGKFPSSLFLPLCLCAFVVHSFILHPSCFKLLRIFNSSSTGILPVQYKQDACPTLSSSTGILPVQYKQDACPTLCSLNA
ncbi:MAG: hypothetical protein ACRCT1_20495 [Microcoleaceae cyanobacterium]